MCVPGKATLTERLEQSSEEDDLARVARRAGERLVDKGRFAYVVQADGSFEVTSAPVPFTASKGRRITLAELPAVWGVLHDLLLAQPPATAPAPRAAKPAPAAGSDAPRAPLSADAMAANDARVRSKPATLEGSTLDIAKTRADLGNVGTHYRRLDLTKADVKLMMTGAKDATAFYCSGFAMWTLAAAGYDLDAPILGTDGKPFSYTAIMSNEEPAIVENGRKSKRLMEQVTEAGLELAADEYPTSGKITFRKLIDGDGAAMMMMTKIEREGLDKGTWLGVHRHPGAAIFDELIDGQDGTARAAKGLAGAFEAFGIGREIPEIDQKPGDFAQTRTRDKDGAYDGRGHAFQVWSVRAHGNAILGEERSPTPVAGAAAAGWSEGVEFVIDKDTDPALVGEHTVVAATRIEANLESSMVPEQKAKADKKGEKPKPGDGGVQITGERPVPATGKASEGLVVFYGRLGSSPWERWTKATRPTE